MTKKIIAAVLAVMTAAALAGCGGSDTGGGSEGAAATTAAAAESVGEDKAAAESTADTAESKEADTPAADGSDELKAPVADGAIDPKGGATENMLTRSVLNRGDTSRLAQKLKAAKELAANKELKGSEKAELMTKIAFLGDSITEGSSPKSADNHYIRQFQAWWEENFSFYADWTNAGIGATDSYLAVHRVDEDVLANQPDIIFIEFINDQDNDFYKSTMDSLVRKCLAQPNDPAVILIEMTQENGTCPQRVHSEIGLAYDLPIISYHDAVLPEIKAGNLNWKDISPDNIHPNDEGHIMLAQMLESYIASVAEDCENAPAPTPFDKSAVESPTGDKYADACIAGKGSELVKVLDEGDFTEETQYWKMKDGWRTKKGGTISFEIECKNLGILYWMVTDGTGGTATVSIDGTELKDLSSDFTGGWGDYAKNEELICFEERGKHTVTVTVPDEKNFEILRWMIS